MIKLKCFVILLFLLPTTKIVLSEDIYSRSTEDRVDDLEGYQTHVVYMIPSDGIDRKLDQSSIIQTSITASINWFIDKTDYEPIFDRFNGLIDVTFFQSKYTTNYILSTSSAASILGKELTENDKISDNKRYMILFDGKNTACGKSSSKYDTFALFLESDNCDWEFTTDSNTALEWELGTIHEFIHTDGLVADCAPHIAPDGFHVIDDPRDIMYFGDEEWIPQFVDVNNDDYFNHDNDNCPDLVDSNYIKFRDNEKYIISDSSKIVIIIGLTSMIILIILKRYKSKIQFRKQIISLK